MVTVHGCRAKTSLRGRERRHFARDCDVCAKVTGRSCCEKLHRVKLRKGSSKLFFLGILTGKCVPKLSRFHLIRIWLQRGEQVERSKLFREKVASLVNIYIVKSADADQLAHNSVLDISAVA